MDILLSSAGLLLLSPLFVLMAVLIKIDSPGPVFYRARRVGRDGHGFRLYKFRSMSAGADLVGPMVTTAGDSRVTRLGRTLRRTKVDELPQLINVLKGDMSLVGPRPEDPGYVAHYTPAQREILRARPGITSPASLKYRHEEQLLSGTDWETTYLAEVMPAKLEIDLDYLSRRTILSDLKIMALTVMAMFQGNGAGVQHKS